MSEEHYAANGYGEHTERALSVHQEATNEPQSEQSKWDQLWDTVNKNPEDFTSWEYLIREAEGSNGGVSKASSVEEMTRLRAVYDAFLQRFPLCFGYWRKYADWENSLEGPEKAAEIFERGVTAIPNSVDLWVQYCSFRIENISDNSKSIRELFNRGADAVGQDFLSHGFWEKYIEFEKSKENYGAVLAILERVIRIPLPQYATFFEEYSKYSVSRPLNELLPANELKKLEEEVRRAPLPEGQTEPRTDLQVEATLRQRIHDIKSEIYMKTQDAVLKRWGFESEIKRPYFHVKPLDEAQLDNWRKYLTFEENEGDAARARILYERCLVACALYEEFWLRYVRYLKTLQDVDGVRQVYVRATGAFLPPSKVAIRLWNAAFEEENGAIDAARTVYRTILEQLPEHVETLSKFAHFERRQGDIEGAQNMLDGGMSTLPDDKGKGFLAVQRIKMHYHSSTDVDSTRDMYMNMTQQYPQSRYLWLSYLLFELAQPGVSGLEFAAKVWDQLKASSLATCDKHQVGLRYLDTLVERSADIATIDKVDMEVHRDFGDRAVDSPASKKRQHEDSASHRPVKQARSDSVAAATPTPTAATSAYAYPQATGYAGYDQSQASYNGYYGAAASTSTAGWDYSGAAGY
ncbi:hypothetical protein HDU85_001940 [Gaertneriomyces sp. JEL0708]|nr:hypothetical protein HDU85_001940 [Gaertneriomyces sp. JEL0708]